MDNLRYTLLALGVRLLRRLINTNRWTYALLTVAPLQPLIERLQPALAYAVYLRAQRRCPAYRAFLGAQRFPRPRRAAEFAQLPITDKPSYVKAYTLEARCYNGRLPLRGVVIDESSGSSGVPNNWVRGPEERAEVKRQLQLSFDLAFSKGPYIMLNCFALGPWATGMNVSMSLVDLGVMKSLGPDQAKLDNTLALFGPRYRYIVLGYPPFIKAWVDRTALDLRQYKIDVIVGGEGISEGLRGYLKPHFGTIFSSYGASDLEINMAAETDLTVRLRELCCTNPSLARELFGRDTPPMIFQYNPLDYYVETTSEGELVFTICRRANVAPKIRYNLLDTGGTLSYRALAAALRRRGIRIETLARRRAHFPLLYVFGRNDLSVPFYGAKVTPGDLEQVISGDAQLVRAISSFQLSTVEDEGQERRLLIRLEQTPASAAPLDAPTLHATLFDGLARCNQDFREVTRMFARDRVVVELHAHGCGPFAGQDMRIKRKYVV